MTSYYDIEVEDDTVDDVVTREPSAVEQWISDVERIHRRRLNRLVVGLDVEWRPSFSAACQNPADTLQLCVGRRCLVLQLLHAPYFPDSLRRFLSGEGYTFAGVGITDDVQKLRLHHGLSVSNAVDIAAVAAEAYGDRRLRNAGLKGLARRALGVEIGKPKAVRISAWDAWELSFPQVRYACSDAFLSFEIGRVLEAWRY